MATTQATNKEKTVEVQPERKRTRQPFGVPRLKLSVPFEIPGYHLHWINDTTGRIQEALNGDYEFVDPKEVGVEGVDGRYQCLVGTNEDGSAQIAYLMKIRQDWYDEDQKALSKVQDQFDDAIKQGKLDSTPGDNRYVPREGINYKN